MPAATAMAEPTRTYLRLATVLTLAMIAMMAMTAMMSLIQAAAMGGGRGRWTCSAGSCPPEALASS